MKKFFGSKRNIVLVSIGAVLAAVVAVFVATMMHYANHALPGALVAGQPVGGMTREQVAQVVTDQLSGDVVEVGGAAQPTQVSLAEVGIDVDVEKTVDEVFAPNRGFATRISSFSAERDIEPVITVNTAKLDAFADGLEAEAVKKAANGTVTFDPETKLFVATGSEPGAELDTTSLEQTLLASAKAMTFQPVSLEVVEVSPDYDTAAAQAAAAEANSWLDLEVKAWDRNERGRYPEREEMAPWLTFTPEGGALEVGLDPAQVKQWVSTVSGESNIEATPGIQNVNSRGDVLAMAVEGNDGYVVNNVDALTTGIIEAVTAGQPFSGTMEYTVEERTYTQRLIADGAENLVYKAAPGEKWIDINLSNHTVTAYEGATPVQQSPMVAGAPATPTVTGEYSVWAKVATQTMRGDNVDGTKYETPDVPWILYFHGGYATHGAYWRSSFGYDAGAGGSHGCVNMPVGAAYDLYSWADVGTKVVSHY